MYIAKTLASDFARAEPRPFAGLRVEMEKQPAAPAAALCRTGGDGLAWHVGGAR